MPAQQPVVVSRLRARLARSFEDLFFAPPGTPSEDPLVVSVRRDAAGARLFIASAGVFSAYMGMLVCAVCSAFLALNWGACSGYDRPLRWWVLIYVILQACQLPLRLVLVVGLRNAERAGHSIEAFLTSLTASRAWQMGGVLGRLIYTWQVLGALWWLGSESCPSCPGIPRLMAAVLLTTALRGAVVFVASRLLARSRQDRGRQERRGRSRSEAFPEEECPAVVSATPGQIKALPCVKFTRSRNTDFCTSCSICLSEFDDGEILKKLPCGHLFHDDCVASWLRRNKRCPLCVRAIDDHCKAA